MDLEITDTHIVSISGAVVPVKHNSLRLQELHRRRRCRRRHCKKIDPCSAVALPVVKSRETVDQAVMQVIQYRSLLSHLP